MNTAPNKIKLYRQTKGWSLQQLAEATGTSKSQIDKLEKGQRRLSVDWMVRLAKPLGCDPRDLLALRAQTPEMDTPTPRQLPVFALDLPSQNLSGRAIDQTPCPTVLMHVPDAYALIAPDDSMAPMYRRGQTLYLHPHKPPQPTCGLLVRFKNGTAQIRAYIQETPQTLRLRSFGDSPKEEEISLSEIERCDRIVGTMDLF